MSLLNRARRRVNPFPWERYWVERGGSYEADNDGFTIAPGTIHPILARRNSVLSTLDALDDVRCVLALGDPGLGKSWEVDAYVARLAARREAPTDGTGLASMALLAFDLAAFQTHDQLRAAVFDAPECVAWKGDGASVLYLVLDSLDESRMLLTPLCEYLLDQLTGLPLDRLRLRIACRTAVLPRPFQLGLATLFTAVVPEGASPIPATENLETTEPTPNEETPAEVRGSSPSVCRRAMAAVEIVPLTRQNAEVTAEHQLGGAAAAAAFLGAVDAADVGHFAARPQTLMALIHRFRAGASLQVPQTDLFRDLIEHACDPTLVSPRGNEIRPTRTSRRERVRVAARICAAQLLGNRPTITLNADDAPDAALLDLRDLTGEEPLAAGALRVDETVLAEAVNTPLFTGRGESRIAPHQTFAEYLAASWLVDRDVPFAQLVSLLVDALDPQRKVVPQLRQVTAWLAAMRVDVFDAVVRREPEIVLWSDVVQVPVTRRPALVAALLDAAERNRLDLPERSITDRLARLEHPALAAQLSHVVTNRDWSDRARDLALDIAYGCRLSSLGQAAAAIALDPTESLGLRVEAARLVAAAGVESDRRKLILLATQTTAEDVGDDLKGSALRACYALLPPDALFGALTMPKRANWGGSYMIAFAEIARHLGPEHLDAGCAWLQRGVWLSSVTGCVAQRIIRLGLERLDDSKVRAAVAAFYWAHASRHEAILGPQDRDETGLRGVLRDDAGKRRALLAAIVEATPPRNHGLFWLDRDMPDAVRPEDVPWMLDQLAAHPVDATAREAWRDVLLHRFDYSSREHLAAALSHRTDSAVLALTGQLVADCATVDEALEAIRRAREDQAQNLATAQRRQPRPRRDLPFHGPLQSLGARLAGAVAPAIPVDTRWSKAMVELCRATDGSEIYGQPTVTQIQGLNDPPLVVALIEAAERYLANGEVPQEPYADGQVKWSVIFGFFAGVLLYEHAPERLWEIDETVWTKWARSFAGYGAVSAEDEVQRALLEVSLVIAPTATSAELQRAVERYAASGLRWLPDGMFSIAAQVDDIAEALGEDLAAGTYSVDREFELLGRLLDERPEVGERWAREILKTRPPRGTGVGGDRRVATLATLLLHAPRLAWPVLRRRAWANDDIARKVILRAAAMRDYPKHALEQLDDDQVGELYVLVDRLFPWETDIWHTGVYSPSARDNIEDWRRALPHALETRRRESAVAALLRAAEADPSRDHRVRIWLRATAVLRTDRWSGVHPRELMALAGTPHLRLVESGGQLLDLVVESLGRLQQELQGQWRSVVGLWDERAKGRWVPKQESHLAHELARHLQRDLGDRGVVIGRELVLQIGISGGAGGLRTDIDVTATALEATRRAVRQVRVVIEVKGSWHPDVLTALRRQMVDQYMTPHGVRQGLYVVGEYTCASWVNSASKRRSIRLGGPEALAHAIKQQAAAVTNEMREVRATVLNVALPAARRSSGGRGAGARPRRSGRR